MQFRPLGKTKDRVPVIGMGTWKIGSTQSQAEWNSQVEALRKGMDLGMTLIDTAEIYGSGKSEQLVGEAVKSRRAEVFIATKVYPGHLHYDDVIRACNSSLQRLGINQIDLYQVHWPNPSIPIEETMRAMENLVSAGKVRYVGVSNFSVEQTKAAQSALSKVEIVSNQVEYSLTDRSIEHDLLPYCEKAGITVIAYSPLARGRIPESQIPADLVKYGTPAQIMLNWVTYKESVIAIPKSASVGHLEENAKAVDRRLTKEDYALLSERFR
jgi:diketogulonate reductase-like aldo/keto reductase